MFNVAIFLLLVCSVGLATVNGMNPQQPRNQWPEVVNARKYFCQARGSAFIGACVNQNLALPGTYVGQRCDQVYCAEATSVAGVFNAIPKGPAPDGMQCSSRGACINHICVDIKTPGLSMPFQLGPDVEYPCVTVRAVRPSVTGTSAVARPH